MNFRKYLFVIIFFLVLAGVHLFFYARNITFQYQLTGIKVRLAELTSQNRELGGLAAKAEDLAYVEKTAREKLGMIYPAQVIYILGTREVGSGPATK